MEEHLRKLVAYAEPKPTFFISISGNKSRLKTSCVPPLEFSTSFRYEMALTSLETYYSFPNIETSNNHIKVLFDNAWSWKDVRIQSVYERPSTTKHCYEIEAINNVLQRFIMTQTGDKEDGKRVKLSPNPNTLRFVLEILDRKCRVDFNVENSLRSVLGFNKRIYKVGLHESENLVNILSVNSILVHCDVIESSRLNVVEAPVIYNFFPDVAPGDKIVVTPLHLIYIPLTLNIISHMTCWLTDQNGKELDLRGEEVTITFHVKVCC